MELDKLGSSLVEKMKEALMAPRRSSVLEAFQFCRPRFFGLNRLKRHYLPPVGYMTMGTTKRTKRTVQRIAMASKSKRSGTQTKFKSIVF